MIKVGIVGGAGYTGGELIRLLLNHPQTEIAFVNSHSQAGKAVSDVHRDLLGECDLEFSDDKDLSADVLFLAMAHGDSQKFLVEHSIPTGTAVIDLSQDFRLENNPQKHDFVYGLPELNRPAIRQAKRVANPGCFATAIQLAALPLAKAGLLKDDLHVNAITGSTGAGQRLSETVHYTWRSGNVSFYKVFRHQHLKEINQSIKQLQTDWRQKIHFVPVRGNFTRGILAGVYTSCGLSLEKLKEMYREFYRDHLFTIVCDSAPDIKQVVNTNKCLVHVDKTGDQVFVTSVIDNLLKGASGQAVQNMNLMCGLAEDSGLRLKPSAF